MILCQVTLHHVRMTLKTPFANSLTTVTDRELILVEAEDEAGRSGWGECVAFSSPWYTEETIGTAWHVMKDFLIPRLLHTPLQHPGEVPERFRPVRRHPMAKAALEGAVWDLWCKAQGLSLAGALGGTRARIEAGVAVGAADPDCMLETIRQRVEEGYRRVKVKVKPGADVEVLERIREVFPELPLMADANSAYTLKDLEHLKRMDTFNLLMIEQPLAADDIVDHARLQAELATPICLDESLQSFEDVRKALELGSCRIVNVKVGRVGGLTEAKRIHDLCQTKGIPLWCGGMLESGIARAHNIALASLEGFNLPGDISASNRYWERDLIHPEVTVEEGRIAVPEGPGIGFEVDRERLQAASLYSQVFTC
ncbi:o-succinylbenzoate synthase [Kroppenstedtia eburnea]|uniref:o-succinylbenzoate synthase n=1 Tax=Kroppenstedtia eburnea TaxID=714067 RepID=A0A1N7L7P5_9BACL|nr:o-succinylbenzoate synthase [Kroppenstedtia eburnea]QKI81484.1 o-succinylbenzoate synthase [Kroppenstedtia eburnea]SIS69882.1 O-succinylbenzoate synthase [Kroppenstedtia eburnea]